jgi:hypothetical protein
MTIHGTNAVYLYGNVGFNVFGHCYYLGGRRGLGLTLLAVGCDVGF